MKLRSSTTTSLPRELWRSIANVMSLAGALPAEHEQPNTLIVEVGAEHRSLVGQPATYGDYGDRLIRLFPCPNCSVGLLTHTLLHELAHAWIEVFHPNLPVGGPEEEFAGLFSDLAYTSLPGRLGSDCSSYQLELPSNARRSRGFQRFFRHFVDACPSTPRQTDVIDACRVAAKRMNLVVVRRGLTGERGPSTPS